MNKQEFLNSLSKGLSGLPQEDISERVGFYSEMIDDRIEEGLSEEKAIAEIGTPEDIVAQIVDEYPIGKLVKEKVRSKRRLRAWEIVLLAVGSPLWVCLLIIAVVLIFVFYIVIWVLVIVLWAIFAAFILSSIACIAGGIYYIFRGEVLPGVAAIGAGVLMAGLSIFLFFGCRAASRGAVLLIRQIFRGIKSLFIRKENNK